MEEVIEKLSLQNLQKFALDFKDDGEYEEAQKYYEQALRKSMQEYGENSLKNIPHFEDFAEIFELQEKEETAVIVLKECLKMFKKYDNLQEKSENNPEITILEEQLDLMYKISEHYFEMSKYSKGLNMYDQIMEIYLKQKGELSTEVANLYYKMASIYKEQEKFQKALLTYERSINIFTQLTNDYDPSLLQPLLDTAEIYEELDNNQSAIDVYEQCCEIYEKQQMFTVEYAECLESLGDQYFDKEEKEKSIKTLEKSLEIMKQAVGPDDIDNTSILKTLGDILIEEQRHKEALVYFKEAERIQKIANNLTSKAAATITRNIAEIYQELDNFKQAIQYFKLSQQIYQQKFGDDCYQQNDCVESLAEIYMKTNNLDEAKKLYIQSLQLYKNKFGKNCFEQIYSLKNLADIFYEQENYPQSIDNLKKCLKLYDQQFGENNLEQLDILRKLGQIYLNINKINESKKYYYKAKQICEDNLSDIDEVEYSEVLNDLGDVLEEKKQYQEALSLYEQSYEILKENTDNQEAASILTLQQKIQETQSKI